MNDPQRWVMDTSTYTHLCRSGHADIIKNLAPTGVVIVPTDVNAEIDQGRERHEGIPAVSSVGWAEVAVLSEEEVWTQLGIKAQLGGRPDEHLGECAVIACAKHRNMIAILDDRAAVAQADRIHVPNHDTLWIVIEAYRHLYDRDRDRTARVVDDLLATGMFLPLTSGESLLTWAYEEGLLP
jgi:predicted nucleic acid-binding protein